MAGKFPELPLPLSQGDAETEPTLGLGADNSCLVLQGCSLTPHAPQGQDLGTALQSQQGKAKAAEEGEQAVVGNGSFGRGCAEGFSWDASVPVPTELLLGLLWDLGHPHLQWELEYRG